MTAEIAIVCNNMCIKTTEYVDWRIKLTVENSYNPTPYPSERAVGEKYAYCMMKYMIADYLKLLMMS